AANVVNQSEGRVLHLDFPGFPPELKYNSSDLGPACRTYRMALGKQAAVDVNRDTALPVGFPGADQVFSLAGPGETKVFICHQLCDSKTVMYFCDVHISGRNAGHLVGLPGSFHGRRKTGEPISSGHVDRSRGGSDPFDPDRLFRKGARLVLTGDNNT